MQDQILTLTITAVDPVAFALTWLLAWVAKSPAVQSALRDELAGAGRRSRPGCTIATALPDGDMSGNPANSPDLAHGRGTAADGTDGDPGIPSRTGDQRRSVRVPGASARGPLPRAAGIPPGTLSVSGNSVRTSTSRSAEAIAAAWGPTLAPMEMKLVLATILSRGRLVLEDAGGADVRYGTMVGPDEDLTIGLSQYNS